MKQMNFFYISLIPVGAVLFAFFALQSRETVSFYGFAETNETEINYNHPVMVDRIHVTPGQYVTKGTTLLNISRIATKETLADQDYRISELLAEEAIWQQEKQNEIQVLRAERQIQLEALEAELATLKQELVYQRSLANELTTLETTEASYQPLLDKIAATERERTLRQESYDLRMRALENKKRVGNSPYREQIIRLKAELQFDEDNRIRPITVTAPADGLVGNVQCKEAEHISSFQTLLSFYEPHPHFVRGYVHEDLSLQVSVGDVFRIKSLKDESIAYEGRVTGLGSRIIEIPVRLRKMPEVPTYGREVTVKISPENAFLQKEKVALELVTRREQKKTANAQAQKQ